MKYSEQYKKIYSKQKVNPFRYFLLTFLTKYSLNAIFLIYRVVERHSKIAQRILQKRYFISISFMAKIGFGLLVIHPQNNVFGSVILGKNCRIYHNLTFARKYAGGGGTPVLGDGVFVFPHSIIVGPVHVGNNSQIGAGSVVVKDVSSNKVVVGNPAREIIKEIN